MTVIEPDEANQQLEKGSIPGIVILTHGKTGEELIKSAEMIVGKLENVASVALMPGEDPQEYQERVAAVLADMPRGTLIMVDLFGGTPSNCAVLLSLKYSVAVVSGVSLPMLIEAASLRKELSGEQLAEAVLAVAKGATMNVLSAVKNHQ